MGFKKVLNKKIKKDLKKDYKITFKDFFLITMNKKLLIFGNGQIAELANFYFTKFSNLKIEAFILDKEFIKESSFCEKPIIPLDKIKERFNTKEYSFFIALGYQGVNEIRKKNTLK